MRWMSFATESLLRGRIARWLAESLKKNHTWKQHQTFEKRFGCFWNFRVPISGRLDSTRPAIYNEWIILWYITLISGGWPQEWLVCDGHWWLQRTVTSVWNELWYGFPANRILEIKEMNRQSHTSVCQQKMTDCDSQGIGAGCYDAYTKDLDCQWIAITRVHD